ncbi:MAG: hypothetical protein WA642_24860, partial [Steroidobacteraceae bacterium]
RLAHLVDKLQQSLIDSHLNGLHECGVRCGYLYTSYTTFHARAAQLDRVTIRAPETAALEVSTGGYGPYDDNRRSISLI